MNQLEKEIIDAAKQAQKDYDVMSGGRWLSHGPESFLTCTVANRIIKKADFWVFIDASPKKIKLERDTKKRRGRPNSRDGQRFDIVIWQKSKNDVRSIIEVKRAYNISPLLKDRKKIARYINENDFVKTGYLLAYTEAKDNDHKKNTLEKRIKNWADGLDCSIAAKFVDKKSDGTWVWAVCLLRLNNV